MNITRFKAGSALIVVFLVSVAVMSPIGLSWITAAQADRAAVGNQLSNLRRVQSLLVDAETGQRGYLITGNFDFLAPYRNALAKLPAELTDLQTHYAVEGPEQRAQIAKLLRNAKLKLDELSQTVQLRSSSGFAAVEPIVSSAHGKTFMVDIRAIAARLEATKTAELRSLDEGLRLKVWYAVGLSMLGSVLMLSLMAYLALITARATREREATAKEAHQASEMLEAGMVALQRRNHDISVLGEMSRILQTELTLIETLEVTSLFCDRLLPGTLGSVYLFRHSANLLERGAHWGDDADAAATLEPKDCWGLRRGQVHRSSSGSGLRCKHCGPQATTHDKLDVCLPLAAYGEVLGLLHVCIDASERSTASVDEVVAMAQVVSEQIALALSNAKLRVVLRDQSIKDPLTGLYNRRYMEETLERELARALRNGTSVSIVVADLDHFKAVNDAHGHPAGDSVLRAAAKHMASMLRGSDVACRFGGEEFALILPDCSKSDAVLKAQSICDQLRAMQHKVDAGTIVVTASFGVASSQEDGALSSALFEAADRAVYEAKRGGRDRVVAASNSRSVRGEAAHAERSNRPALAAVTI